MKLSVPDQHRFKIALSTLTKSDAGARICGGQTKEEARKFLLQHKERLPDTVPLYVHAELWATENGETVPPEDTPEYQAMYERWHAFAFAGFIKKEAR